MLRAQNCVLRKTAILTQMLRGRAQQQLEQSSVVMINSRIYRAYTLQQYNE